MLRRSLAITFLLFVFASTFSISLSQSLAAIAVALGIVIVIREKSLPLTITMRPVWAAIAIYVTWLLAVCLYQDEPLRSLDHIREEWLFVLMPLGLLALPAATMRERLVQVLSAGLLMISVASLLMYLFGVQYHWGDGFTPLPAGNPRVRGNFTHALTFGNYAAIASAFVIAWVTKAGDRVGRVTRWLALASGFFGLVAVLLCGSRGPVLAFAAGMVVLIFVVSAGRRKWLIGFMVALVIVGASVPTVRSRFGRELAWHFDTEWAGGRLFIWEHSLKIIAAHPLTGVGPGNFSEAYKAALPADVTDRYWYGHAHNDFLQAAARSGMLGMLVFGNLWLAMGRLYRTAWKRAGPSGVAPELTASLVGSVVFLVASMTEATFSDEEVRILLMLVWSIGLVATYNVEAGPTARASA
jgi:O-antigen ligase